MSDESQVRKGLASRVSERLPRVNVEEQRVLFILVLLLGVVTLTVYNGVTIMGALGALLLLAGAVLTVTSLGLDQSARRDVAGALLLLGGGLAAFSIKEFDLRGLLTIAGLAAAPLFLFQTTQSLAIRRQFAPRALPPARRALRRALDRRLGVVLVDLGIPTLIFPLALFALADAITSSGTLLLFTAAALVMGIAALLVALRAGRLVQKKPVEGSAPP